MPHFRPDKPESSRIGTRNVVVKQYLFQFPRPVRDTPGRIEINGLRGFHADLRSQSKRVQTRPISQPRREQNNPSRSWATRVSFAPPKASGVGGASTLQAWVSNGPVRTALILLMLSNERADERPDTIPQKLAGVRNLTVERGLGVGAGKLPYLSHRSYRSCKTSTLN